MLGKWKFLSLKISTPQFSFKFCACIPLLLLDKFLHQKSRLTRPVCEILPSRIRNFSRAFYAQITISTLQDLTLRTRENGPLISKARDPRETTRILNVLSKVFGFVDFRFEIGSKYNRDHRQICRL